MRIAGLVQDSIVDGPGLRFVVFTQGCDLDCNGCHNPAARGNLGGSEMTVEEIIAEMSRNPLTDGLTLSGGEPSMQAAGCAQLASAARTKGLSVWMYSGYTFEELISRAKAEPDVRELLELIDVLVDGRFKLEERTLSTRWRGSQNQRVLDVQKSLAQGSAVQLQDLNA